MGSRSARTLEGLRFSVDILKEAFENEPIVKTFCTPLKNFEAKKGTTFYSDNDTDVTPIKNPLPLKRRSLMCDMNWAADLDNEAAKHPMQMRSRRSRKPKKDYCKPEDYVDYAEDLSFLFDDDLPDLNCRPRRKPRKKRAHLLTPNDLTGSHHSADHFSDFEKSDAEILAGVRDMTSSNFQDGNFIQKSPTDCSINSTNSNLSFPNTSSTVEKRKFLSAISDFDSKRQKVQLDDSGEIDKTHVSAQKFGKKAIDKNGGLTLDCTFRKTLLFSPKVTLTPIPEGTVTRMALRRRHSTPTVGGSSESIYNKPLSRTLSVGITKLKLDHFKKEAKPPKISGEEDSCVDIEFVDSPDSGFSSETSCCAGTPDAETVRSLDGEGHKENSSDESEMAGDMKSNEGGFRLNLDGEAVLRKERMEKERRKKQEENELRQKYRCRWVECPDPSGSMNSADLHQHLEKFHAENYCCKWEGCKVFGKESRKLSFLQRHIAEHSGEKPYKCILDGCDASFSSLRGRQRHVEAHYSEVTYPKARVGDNNAFSRYLLNSRRIKDKRRTLANRHDCMDNGTMSHIKSALIQNEVAMETEYEAVSDLALITFHAQVIGKRCGFRGREELLVRWKPANLIPDEWVSKSNFVNVKQVRRNELPDSARQPLQNLLFFGRKNSSRKSSLLKSMF